MTATGSAIPAAIDALVASLTTLLPDVLVIDGMPVTDASVPKALCVGMRAVDPTGPDEAAVSNQQWANLGRNTRDETLSIHMLAAGWDGGGNQKRARDAAFDVVNALAGLIQTDPKLGGSVLVVTGVSDLTLSQCQYADGAVAYIPLDLTARARLS